MGISIIKIRQSWDRLILIMGIPIQVRQLNIETAPVVSPVTTELASPVLQSSALLEGKLCSVLTMSLSYTLIVGQTNEKPVKLERQLPIRHGYNVVHSRLDISRSFITRYCTQHRNCTCWTYTYSELIKYNPYVAVAGELLHYIDVIMTTVAAQITSLTVVYSIVYSDADQRKHQSFASLAIVRGIHRDRWIPRTKGQ